VARHDAGDRGNHRRHASSRPAPWPHAEVRLPDARRVRETEAEAREAANRLLSKLDAAEGEAIRNRSLDTTSAGVSRQAELRDTSDDEGFVEDHLWTGIARARSGCGAAIVGDPDQVVAKIRSYMELGIDSFILSGYPHVAQCHLVAEHVLPALRRPDG
jgi:alkanesulfonate monooxygenase